MICGFSCDAFSELFLFYMFSVLTVVCGGEYICLSECEYVYVEIGVMEVSGQKHWELLSVGAGNEFWSSMRIICTLNYCAIFPVCLPYIYKMNLELTDSAGPAVQ